MASRWWRTPILIYPLLGAFLWTALELWRFPEVWAQESPPRPSRPANRPAAKFTDHLKDLRGLAKQAGEAQARGGDLAPAMAALRQARQALQQADRAIRDEFAATEQKLRQGNLPAEILQRHADAIAAYDAKHRQLESHFNEAEDAHGRIVDPWNFEDRTRDHGRLKDSLKRAQDFLEKHLPKVAHRPLDPNKLPHRPAQPRWQAPRTSSRILPTYALPGSPWLAAQEEPDPAYVTRLAAAGENLIAQVLPKGSGLPPTPTSADLAPTEDVQITQEIRDLAAQLGNDPVKIYEYVRNTIDFEPTWGSIKGSVLTLWERSGNAFDTASLLIALFRAANIPARYVLGTIQVPAAQAQNWVGGVATPQIAATILASGGVPVSYSATHVTLEHVWVEAYVPFAQYRGVPLGPTGKTWIPLDASSKLHNFTSGRDPATTLPFNLSAYLAGPVATVDPVQQYQADLFSMYLPEDPETPIEELKARNEINAQELGLLPSTLSGKAVAVRSEFADLPDTLRHGIRFEIQHPNDSAATVTGTFSLPPVAGRRLTLSYQPASSEDEAAIAAYGGFLYDVPAYLLQVRPTLRLDGTTILIGPPLLLGAEHGLSIELLPASSPGLSVSKHVVAGAYYALALAFGRTPASQPGAKNGRLITTLQTGDPALVGNDELIGEHLAALADMYFLIDTRAKAAAGELYRVVQWRQPAIATSVFTVATTEVFGIPRTVRPSGIEFDVRLNPMLAVSRSGDTTRVRQFMEITGLAGSFWEHGLFESIHGFPAVSAVKALQAANAAGIPVHRITPATAATLLPRLQLPATVIADIQNALAAGLETQIPERDVAINDWLGVGYIVTDPVTGAGTYRISGGINGGSSTSTATGDTVIEVFRGPFAWLRNALDAVTRNLIATAAAATLGDDVTQLVEKGAREWEGVKYDWAGRCTGLVIHAYQAAGINLYDLAKQYGIGSPTNVSNLYFLAKLPQFFIRLGNQAVGDIVFFKNTYPRPSVPGDDGVTHAGIVVRNRSETEIDFMHASGRSMKDAQGRTLYDKDEQPRIWGVIEATRVDLLTHVYWKPRLLGFGRPRKLTNVEF